MTAAVQTMERDRRCAGTTTDGHPCAVPPEWLRDDGAGRFWCRAHDPDPAVRDAHRAATLLGGATTRLRSRRGLDPGELGPLSSPAHAQQWAATIARAVAEGRLSASAATAIVRSLSEWTKARDLHVRETRLTRLEQQMQKLGSER